MLGTTLYYVYSNNSIFSYTRYAYILAIGILSVSVLEFQLKL